MAARRMSARTRRAPDQGLPSSWLRSYRSKKPSRFVRQDMGRGGFACSGPVNPAPARTPGQPHARPDILTVAGGLQPHRPHLTWRPTTGVWPGRVALRSPGSPPQCAMGIPRRSTVCGCATAIAVSACDRPVCDAVQGVGVDAGCGAVGEGGGRWVLARGVRRLRGCEIVVGRLIGGLRGCEGGLRRFLGGRRSRQRCGEEETGQSGSDGPTLYAHATPACRRACRPCPARVVLWSELSPVTRSSAVGLPGQADPGGV